MQRAAKESATQNEQRPGRGCERLGEHRAVAAPLDRHPQVRDRDLAVGVDQLRIAGQRAVMLTLFIGCFLLPSQRAVR
jgi:hypothetical protein